MDVADPDAADLDDHDNNDINIVFAVCCHCMDSAKLVPT